jgi:signal peptidase
MKVLNLIYYVLLAFVVMVAILLIFSAFPIAGNYKIFVVQSGSMAPAIKVGSIVVVKPAEDYKIGDVITFGPYSKTKAPTTHRIYDIKVVNGQPVYITKGDANNAPDTREIAKRDILGKVLFSIPYLGYAVAFAKKPLGFVLIVIVPAVIIIVDEIKNIYKEIKKKKEPTVKENL